MVDGAGSAAGAAASEVPVVTLGAPVASLPDVFTQPVAQPHQLPTALAGAPLRTAPAMSWLKSPTSELPEAENASTAGLFGSAPVSASARVTLPVTSLPVMWPR